MFVSTDDYNTYRRSLVDLSVDPVVDLLLTLSIIPCERSFVKPRFCGEFASGFRGKKLGGNAAGTMVGVVKTTKDITYGFVRYGWRRLRLA